ncbi:tRNA lysidine(34) synthetase TilS [Sphingomonas sp. H160509]|uniref:tRNA lysidine(34) synthetase TilS n=1 Tax=Sphingomonas sp. H160509 TaxID=2955313 RepID=UPI0020978264|nr:tRNA lysidine(34) synthetase TilS [Sphingomonas sp. H160509]
MEESAMVAAHCATLGISHATLAPSEAITGASIQAQARTTRYALLTDHARAIGAGALVTGHHADDQAETFLMRAARGSGLAGLAGVRARTEVHGVTVIRPLLDWRRAELRAIVRRAEVPFFDDPSNHDDRHDRTRFRRLLDQNEWLGTPNLARAAAALAETDTDVRAMVDWIWTERAKVGGGEVKLAVENLPPRNPPPPRPPRDRHGPYRRRHRRARMDRGRQHRKPARLADGRQAHHASRDHRQRPWRRLALPRGTAKEKPRITRPSVHTDQRKSRVVPLPLTCARLSCAVKGIVHP